MAMWDDSLDKKTVRCKAHNPHDEISEMRAIVKTFKEPVMHHAEQNMPTTATEFYAWVKQKHPNEEALVKNFLAVVVATLDKPGTSHMKEVLIGSVLNSIAANAGISRNTTRRILESHGFKFRDDLAARDDGTYLLLQ